MTTKQDHKNYSAACFNRVWDLLDLETRSEKETEEMVECAHASLWHWMQREDGTPTNFSIGLWQISRVYATVGNAAMAKSYAERCEKVSREGKIAPFFLAYALEARARAEAIGGNREAADKLVAEAEELAAEVADESGRAALLAGSRYGLERLQHGGGATMMGGCAASNFRYSPCLVSR